MTSVTFDTLKFARKLESAGVPIAQAEAIAEAFQAATGEELATKAYLDVKLSELKVDLLKWVIGLVLGQTALLLTVLPRLLTH